MEEMRRLFESGTVGRLLHMDANVSHNNFRKMGPSNWRRDPRQAPAGAWTALGIHLGDMFVSFAGRPVRVAARTASQIFPAPGEDFVSAEIDFENSARGRITCLSTPPFYGRFTMVCDQGWVRSRKAETSTRAFRRVSYTVLPMGAGRAAISNMRTRCG